MPVEVQMKRSFEDIGNEIDREKKMLHAYNLQLENWNKSHFSKKDVFFFEIYKFLNYK